MTEYVDGIDLTEDENHIEEEFMTSLEAIDFLNVLKDSLHTDAIYYKTRIDEVIKMLTVKDL